MSIHRLLLDRPRRWGLGPTLSALLAVAGCATPPVATVATAPVDRLPPPVQCVPFVRDITGIEIYGDADTWWSQAAARHYSRGTSPQVGAVLVLKAGERLKVGHIAAVRQILGPREIRVSHSNWGTTEATRRLVHDAMPVQDVSPANDWSLTRFWNSAANGWGAPYPAHGFIYPSRDGERRNVPLERGSIPTS